MSTFAELLLSEKPTATDIEEAALEHTISCIEFDAADAIIVIAKAGLDMTDRARIMDRALFGFEMMRGPYPKIGRAFSLIVRRLQCDDAIDEVIAELRFLGPTGFSPVTAQMLINKRFASIGGMQPSIGLIMPRLVTRFHGNNPMAGLIKLAAEEHPASPPD